MKGVIPETLIYPLHVEPHVEDGGFLAFFPDLPGCQTWGESYQAAVANAEEALELFIETLIANGDPLPGASQIERTTAFGVIVRTPVAA